MINLFIYVIQHPQDPAAESDIGLMYLVAGHFGYLEFAIPDMIFPFVRQIANLARSTVSKLRDRSSGKPDMGPGLDSPGLGGNTEPMHLESLEYVSRTAHDSS